MKQETFVNKGKIKGMFLRTIESQVKLYGVCDTHKWNALYPSLYSSGIMREFTEFILRGNIDMEIANEYINEITILITDTFHSDDKQDHSILYNVIKAGLKQDLIRYTSEVES